MTYKHLNTQELTFIISFLELTLLHVLYGEALKLSTAF